MKEINRNDLNKALLKDFKITEGELTTEERLNILKDDVKNNLGFTDEMLSDRNYTEDDLLKLVKTGNELKKDFESRRETMKTAERRLRDELIEKKHQGKSISVENT